MRMFLRFVRRLTFSLLLCIICWLGGYLWFIGQIPSVAANDTKQTDAIVVLTGGAGRIDYGLQLLKENKAKRLFISGINEDSTPREVMETAKARAEVKSALSKHAVVILGYEATNTIGNAQETARWMKQEHLNSLRLVTANYHMPRSLEEFRNALPSAVILPDPVIPERFDKNAWWDMKNSGRILFMEYNKFLAAKLRHAIISFHETGA